MIKQLLGALAALSLMAAGPAFADEKRELELAKQVVEAAGIRAQVQQGIDLTMPAAREQIRAQAPGLDADRFIALFREEMDKMMPSLLADIARIYVDQFTEAELAEIAAFFQSPIGRRLVDRQVPLTHQAAELGRQYGAQAGAAAATRLLAQQATPPANP